MSYRLCGLVLGGSEIWIRLLADLTSLCAWTSHRTWQPHLQGEGNTHRPELLLKLNQTTRMKHLAYFLAPSW